MVGEQIGARLGSYSEKVALPASTSLAVEVLSFVADGSDQVAVEVLDVGPTRLLRDSQERRRRHIVSVNGSDDRRGEPHRRWRMSPPGRIDLFVGDVSPGCLLVLMHQIHLDS